MTSVGTPEPRVEVNDFIGFGEDCREGTNEHDLPAAGHEASNDLLLLNVVLVPELVWKLVDVEVKFVGSCYSVPGV